MTTKRFVTMAEVIQAANLCIEQIHLTKGRDTLLYGIPRGGIPAALAVASEGIGFAVTDNPHSADVIIDDIYDSGATAKRYSAEEMFGGRAVPFHVLFDKRLPQWAGQWLVMPWEVGSEGKDDSATDIITRLLQYIGENPKREGLRETPARVLKAWREWGEGYQQEPAGILKCFEDGAKGCDELVIVHNIPVVSKCEHHLADIVGHAHVGYIPNGKIVGLSKLARLTDLFARRLQVQERLTVQIADALVENLDPVGVGVLIRASHACMSTRGVKIHGSVTTTSAMRGALMNKPEARQEFMQLCAMAERQS